MSKRPQTSVLLIGTDELVRTDVGGDDVAPFRGPRPAGVDDLTLLVEAALALGPTPGRQVLVLASDLWTQVVELPASSPRGASAIEIEQALKFETEGLSGLSAFESALGYAPLSLSGGARRYWVTQLTTGELDAIDDLLRERGLRLQGVAHPGGLPVPLNGSGPGAPWRRTELWPGLRLELSHTPQSGLSIEVEPSDPQDQDLALDEGDHHLLVGTDLRLSPPAERHPSLLADSATLARWAAAWCDPASTREAPCVRPTARPLPSSAWIALSVLLAAFTLAVCWGHALWINNGVAELEAELERLRPQPKEDQLARKQRELEQSLSTLKQQLSDVEATLTGERCRVADLLGALGEAPTGIVLEGIEDRGRSVTILGSAPDPELPSQLAARLADSLLAHGWRMAPPKSALMGEVDGVALWRFEIELTDPRTDAPQPAQRKTGRRR